MRVLWEDHIVWTRMAIIGIVDDRADQSFAVERLLQNQDDIGDAIKPVYGEAAGDALTALLREHTVGAADLLVAAMTGVGFDAAHAAWYAKVTRSEPSSPMRILATGIAPRCRR
jgi:hypothetical protein